jgi:hypothetical protein
LAKAKSGQGDFANEMSNVEPAFLAALNPDLADHSAREVPAL